MHRTMRFTRGVVLLFVLLLSLSGCAGLRWQSGFSNGKAHRLAQHIAQNIPKPEVDGERRFTWMLFLRPPDDPNSAVSSEVMRAARRNYQVYTDIKSIPPDRIVRTERGIEGFKQGFSFRFSITALAGNRVRVKCWSYGDSRGTSVRATTYAWADGDWRPEKKRSPVRAS